MKSIPALIILSACILVGCKKTVEAPTSLSDLSRYLFREFESDPEPVALGLENLRSSFRQLGTATDGYWLEPLVEEDVNGLERPPRDLSDMTSLGVLKDSPWPVEDHPLYITLDSLVGLSTAAESYDRVFTNTQDPSCFLDQSCEYLRTENYVHRKNFFIDMTYFFYKDFRWVTEENGEAAILSRSWMTESHSGDGGKNNMWQMFEIEAWLENGDQTLRLYVGYQEGEYAGVSDDMARGIVQNGIHSSIEAYDGYIEDFYSD